MARFTIAAPLTAAFIALILIFHLITSFGLPRLDILNLHYEPGRWRKVTHQKPMESEVPLSSNAGGLYLLGVGKADITGYGDIFLN